MVLETLDIQWLNNGNGHARHGDDKEFTIGSPKNTNINEHFQNSKGGVNKWQ